MYMYFYHHFVNCYCFISSFTTLLVTVANADIHNASYKDILTWNIPSPLIVRRLSAMITVSTTCNIYMYMYSLIYACTCTV